MAKKLRFHINYFDEYHLLAVVNHLKDYRLAYHINQKTGSSLKKYDDLHTGEGKENRYAWYCCDEREDHTTLYLISNSNGYRHLIPSKKEIDYFFLIKNAVNREKVEEYTRLLRSIENMVGVYAMDLNIIKDMDVLLETIELHEMEQLKRKTK